MVEARRRFMRTPDMREVIASLHARIESDGRRQALASAHLRRVEASLREINDRIYLLRARQLCLSARLETLRERLSLIEDEVGRLRARRAPSPSPADRQELEPERAAPCPRAA
jgi:chromosome segregation ATPase